MSRPWVKLIGVGLVCIWFAVGGVAHFLSTQSFVRIVPPYVPFPLGVVYITGVFEVLAAAALWMPRWRRATGVALFVFTICVTPANLYMSMNPQLFPGISETALNIRLVMQVLLLACIWWSTRDAEPRLEAQSAGV
jgi:uncharacterized membrane protein